MCPAVLDLGKHESTGQVEKDLFGARLDHADTMHVPAFSSTGVIQLFLATILNQSPSP